MVYCSKANEVPYDAIKDFDCVVINSVAQYFPNIAYFESVLLNAINHISKDGKIFIGDVRSYDLIEDFYKSISNEYWLHTR